MINLLFTKALSRWSGRLVGLFGLIFICSALPVDQIYCQPVNDECIKTIFIPDVRDFCSGDVAFGSSASTPSNNGFSLCQNANGNDVWFTFYVTASDVIVRILCPDGDRLQASLYSGGCGSLNEETCGIRGTGQDFLQLYKGGLVPGTRLYLRVDFGKNNNLKFGLCINNFFAPALDGSDCNTANLLCSKETFTVRNIQGFGKINELDDAPCFSHASESNSIWFRWICRDPGTFTFELVPLKDADDIDFVVYKVRGDPMSCDLELVRCMAAGISPVNCPDNPNCCGPTGLREGETDESEAAGCGPDRNNFLKPLDMKAGEAYALLVNNYTSQNEGFDFRMGGTATFMSLSADIDIMKPDGLCREESLGVKDKIINDLGAIKSIQWTFTPDASIPSSEGAGPKSIHFDRSGYKIISLIAENDAGCKAFAQDTVFVYCCGGTLQADILGNSFVDYGGIQEYGVQYILEGQDIQYMWTPSDRVSCDTCSQVTLGPVYEDFPLTVSVSDENGCKAESSILIKTGQPEIVAPNVFSPNHDGINDRFMLSVSEGIRTVRSLMIFNRWGAMVYEGRNVDPNDLDSGWDGRFKNKDAAPGVYVYYAELETIGGKTLVIKGGLTLIR